MRKSEADYLVELLSVLEAFDVRFFVLRFTLIKLGSAWFIATLSIAFTYFGHTKPSSYFTLDSW